MDIKQRLARNAAIQANSCNDQLDSHICRDALAEIERLEGRVVIERSLKNQARADLVKLSNKLNAYTDRMITAGLMS
jgi:cytochrome c-type biogenesis protein CcmH/NrfG